MPDGKDGVPFGATLVQLVGGLSRGLAGAVVELVGGFQIGHEVAVAVAGRDADLYALVFRDVFGRVAFAGILHELRGMLISVGGCGVPGHVAEKGGVGDVSVQVIIPVDVVGHGTFCAGGRVIYDTIGGGVARHVVVEPDLQVSSQRGQLQPCLCRVGVFQVRVAGADVEGIGVVGDENQLVV